MPNKIFVLDTCILLGSAQSIFNFSDNEVVIPYVVLEELDKHKVYDSDTGRNAREVTRSLNKLRQEGTLHSGVLVNEHGGIVRVELNFSEKQDPHLNLEVNDDRIINVCLGLKRDNPDRIVTLVTNDLNLSVRADLLRVAVESYETERPVSKVEHLYTGNASLTVPSELIDAFYSGDSVLGDDLAEGLMPNQYLTLLGDGDPSKSALVRVVAPNKPIVKVVKHKDVFGISPKNREQQFALDALLNPDIPLVSLTGPAGSGKTLCALAAALHASQDLGRYNRLVVSRPVQPLGKEIGFLPGDMMEKMSPWMGPFKDALDFLVKMSPKKGMVKTGAAFEEMIELGFLEVEPLTFIRGRSLPNTFFLIDEAQDMTRAEMKTLITRMGEGSKIVVIGDILQITNPYIDSTNSGLSHVIEKFKSYPVSAHVTFTKGERSTLATLAAEIL